MTLNAINVWNLIKNTFWCNTVCTFSKMLHFRANFFSRLMSSWTLNLWNLETRIDYKRHDTVYFFFLLCCLILKLVVKQKSWSVHVRWCLHLTEIWQATLKRVKICLIIFHDSRNNLKAGYFFYFKKSQSYFILLDACYKAVH